MAMCYTGKTGIRMAVFIYGNNHGGNNVAYMDGSVNSVKLPGLWDQKWHREWQTLARLPKIPKD